MPQYLQGNVFQAAMARKADLAIVFGHIGFNEMRPTWLAFRVNVPDWSHINDPFTELADEPHQCPQGHWLWFIPDQDNHGMTQGQLVETLDTILEWAGNEGLRTIITNGIADVDHGHNTEANRLSDDHRAEFLGQFMAGQEAARGFKVTLISMNDVFVRNSH